MIDKIIMVLTCLTIMIIKQTKTEKIMIKVVHWQVFCPLLKIGIFVIMMNETKHKILTMQIRLIKECKYNLFYFGLFYLVDEFQLPY